MRRVDRARRSLDAQLAVEVIGLAVLFVSGLAFRYAVVRSLPPGNTAVDGRLDLAARQHRPLRARDGPRRRPRVGPSPRLAHRLPRSRRAALGAVVGPRRRLLLGGEHPGGSEHGRRCRLPAPVDGPPAPVRGDVCSSLLLPAVFGDQDRGLIRRLLRARVMVLAGLISYGTYLWHEGVIDVWMRARGIDPFRGDFATMLIVAVIGTLVGATVSYVVVERPALRRKSSAPRRQPATACSGRLRRGRCLSPRSRSCCCCRCGGCCALRALPWRRASCWCFPNGSCGATSRTSTSSTSTDRAGCGCWPRSTSCSARRCGASEVSGTCSRSPWWRPSSHWPVLGDGGWRRPVRSPRPSSSCRPSA